MFRPYVFPSSPKNTRQTLPDFEPTIDPALCLRAWVYYVRNDRKPIEPDHFQKVMLANQNQEAHIFWVDDFMKWIRGKNI